MLGIPIRTLIVNVFPKVRIAYRKLMDDVVNLLYSRKNSSILMQEVYEFEKALAQVTVFCRFRG